MMIKRKADKFWFPWWPDKWIFGSIRIECTPEERGIWVDLLSLASKDDGYIRANEEIPYPIEQLAGMLMVPQETLSKAIEKFIALKDKSGKGKLTRTKEKTLYVTKWEEYQLSRTARFYAEKGRGEHNNSHSEKKSKLYYSKLKYNKLKYNKEEQNINLTREQEILINEELKTVKGIGEKKRQMLICYLRELSIEFPDIDYVHEMKKKCSWWRDNPLNKKSNIHLQIRNWFNIVQKGFTEARKQQRVGKDAGGHRSKYPMLFLNNVYTLLRKQGKDNAEYSDKLFALTVEEAKIAVEKYKDSLADFIKFLEEKK